MSVEYDILQVTTDGSLVRFSSLFQSVTSVELFQFFTQPDLLVQWWPQVAEIEPRQGGLYKMSWPAMNWHLTGTYLEFDPGRRLFFTWQWSHEPDLSQRLVEIHFFREALGTRLELTHSAYTEEPRDQEDRQSHIDGWMHFLGRLHEIDPGPLRREDPGSTPHSHG